IRDWSVTGVQTCALPISFGRDFTASMTTRDTNSFLVRALRRSVQGSPPTFPPGRDEMTVDIRSLIAPAIAAINDPTSPNAMDFRSEERRVGKGGRSRRGP